MAAKMTLLGLPPEIRLRIFSFILDEPYDHLMICSDKRSRIVRVSRPVPLLLTSRQIHNEAATIFEIHFRVVVHSFGNPSVIDLTSLSDFFRERVTTLKVSIIWESSLHDLRRCKEIFKKLKPFQIELDIREPVTLRLPNVATIRDVTEHRYDELIMRHMLERLQDGFPETVENLDQLVQEDFPVYYSMDYLRLHNKKNISMSGETNGFVIRDLYIDYKTKTFQWKSNSEPRTFQNFYAVPGPCG